MLFQSPHYYYYYYYYFSYYYYYYYDYYYYYYYYLVCRFVFLTMRQSTLSSRLLRFLIL